MAVAALTRGPAPPLPERGRAWSVYDLFITADDDQVFIGVTSERHWERFCRKFGWDDLLADRRLAGNAQRIEARDWLLPELRERLGRLTKAEILTLAEAAEIPFAPVARPEDLAEDVQVKEAHALTETRLPEGQTVKLPKLPLRLDGQSFEARQGPPALGQGGLAFLREAGFGEAEIETLVNQGVVMGG
jgi:crotonobetainyl-CoA:carnitine CoA-transferase CaiB-like acyl-CoA transferase